MTDQLLQKNIQQKQAKRFFLFTYFLKAENPTNDEYDNILNEVLINLIVFRCKTIKYCL